MDDSNFMNAKKLLELAREQYAEAVEGLGPGTRRV